MGSTISGLKVKAPATVREPEHVLFLSPGFRARKALHVDLSELTWISPLGVVAVLSCCLAAQGRGLPVDVDVPDSAAVRTYLAHVGFYAELDRKGWAVDGDLAIDPDYTVGGCLSVASLNTEWQVDEVGECLKEALASAHIPANLINNLWGAAIELTQNAREHGSECYVVAQTHSGMSSGTPGVHIAVADFGPGFAARLSPKLGPLSDESAILRGFEYRITGTDNPLRGLGLPIVCETVDNHDGATLAIMSRTGYVRRAGGALITRTVTDFRGTLASAYFPYTPPTL
jgi:anti-sigma regulatory factor (Ser/Thr protein kinase)